MMKSGYALIALLLVASTSACTQTTSGEMLLAPVGDGGFVEYQVGGNPDGEPVLMIHGGGIAASFLPLMDQPALSDYYLIRYHRRGFAESTDPSCPFGEEEQAADALAVLDHLNIAKAHVVGHSAGGPPALYLAHNAPERVGSIVLLEGGYLPIETMEFAPRIRARIEEKTIECSPADDAQIPSAEEFQRRLTGTFQNFFGEDWETEAERLIPGAIDQVRNDELRRERLSLQFESRYVAEDFYDAIHHPVVDMFGEHGMEGFRRETERNLPNALLNFELWELPGIGHEMQMRWPELVSESIAEWLERHPFD